MDTDPWKQDLDELVERYLDGTLSPGEVSDLEERLEEDEAARDSLINALTARGLAELANEALLDAGPLAANPSAECEQARRAMPAYRAGSLEQSQMGAFVRHLDDCVVCQAFYEVSPGTVPAPAPRRPGRRAMALGLVVVTTLVLIVVFFSSLPEADRMAPLNGAFPVLPVPDVGLPELARLVRQHSTQSDSTSIDLALRQVEDQAEGFLASARSHPGILALLGEEDLSHHSPRLIDEIVFLLVYLEDPRLGPFDRKEALRPLAHRMKAPRAFLWRIIGESREAEFCHVVLERLRELGLREEDSRSTRHLFDRAMDWGNPNTIKLTLEALVDVRHPDAPGLCLGLLRGHYGLFVNRAFPRAAAPLLRFARATKDEAAEQALHAIATGTGPSVGRAVALEVLSRASPSPVWHEAFLGLARDKDSRVRRLVARHLKNTGDRNSLEILDALCQDEDLATSYIARQARQALDSKR